MSFEEQVENAAREIVACPWIVEYFLISSDRQANTVDDIAKKYGLKYFRYRKNSAADMLGLYAPEKIKQEYVQKCYAQHLHDDVSKIVHEYLDQIDKRYI